MNTLVLAGIGSAVIAASAFGLGFKVGGDMKASGLQKRVIEEMQNATSVISRKDGELEQCRAQVDEINRTMAAQGKNLAAKIDADAAKRRRAAQEERERQIASAERMELLAASLSDLLEGIENGTFDECVSSVADPDFVGLLNESLAAASGGGVSGSDSGVPAPSGGD